MTAQHAPVPLRRTAAAVVRLEVIDLVNYPLNALLQQVGLLVPLVVSFFLARLVPADGGTVGGSYFTFAVVGYAVLVLLQGAVGGLGRSLEVAQNLGTLETLLVEPSPWRALPLIFGTYQVLFSTVASTAVLGLGLLLGASVEISGMPGYVAVLVLGACASLAVGTVIASIIVLAKRAAIVLAAYGMVAGLMAGSVFPVELIPGWLRWLAYVVPETYVIDASRQLLMSDPPAPLVSVGTSLVVLAVIALVMGCLGAYTFGRALQYSRRMGLLGGH